METECNQIVFWNIFKAPVLFILKYDFNFTNYLRGVRIFPSSDSCHLSDCEIETYTLMLKRHVIFLKKENQQFPWKCS